MCNAFNKKLITGVISVLLVVLLLCIWIHAQGSTLATADTNIHTDYFSYKSLNEVVAVSEVVLTGKVVACSTDTIDVALNPNEELLLDYNLYEVEVLDVAKGSIAIGDTVVIKQNLQESEFRDYQIGDEAIFMLCDYSEYAIPYSLVNPTQGHIDIDTETNQIEYSYFEQDTGNIGEQSGYQSLWEDILEIAAQ